MLKKFAGTWAMLGLIALVPFRGQAQVCSNATYSGSYSYLITGTVSGSGTAAGLLAYAQLGKVTADGNGNVFGTAMESRGGTVSRLVLSGTYMVNPDCSGTQTLTVTPQSSAQYTSYSSFQLVQNGQAALFSTSSTNAVVTGEFYRAGAQGVTPCGTATLTGTYGFLAAGPPLGSSAPLSGVGEVTFDGKGGLTFKFAVNDNNPGFVGVVSSSGSGSYSVAGDCSGTAAFTLGPASVANETLAIVQGGNILLMETDPGTLFSGVMQPQSTQSVLPQFAFGAGWYSALYFSNETTGAVSFPVSFTADNGTPLSVPPVGGSSMTVTIAAKGAAIVEANNTGPLVQGYVSVSLPAGVTGYGVFRQTVAGVPDQEAVVPLSTASSSASTIVWDDTNFVTSVAIVNLGSGAATVTITLWDNNGNIVGTSALVLGAHQKTEATLRSLPGLRGWWGSAARLNSRSLAGRWRC